jgi:hypothetical protein
VSSDLVHVSLLSLVAMFNPTVLAGVPVMLLLPNPKPSRAWLPTRRYTNEHHTRPADRVLAARLEHREHLKAQGGLPTAQPSVGTMLPLGFRFDVDASFSTGPRILTIARSCRRCSRQARTASRRRDTGRSAVRASAAVPRPVETVLSYKVEPPASLSVP